MSKKKSGAATSSVDVVESAETAEVPPSTPRRTRKPRTPRTPKRVRVVIVQQVKIGDVVWLEDKRGIATADSHEESTDLRVRWDDGQERMTPLTLLEVERLSR